MRKKLEDELRQHRNHLEALVAERTLELTNANEQLRNQIAERERLEHALRQAQKMEAIGRLAGGIAHDFNNLLTAILGYSELLLSDLAPDDPRRKSVEEVKSAGERAAALTVKGMLPRMIGEHIELITLLQPGLRRVKTDPHQIEQVIMNLAVNARDAMPAGGKLTIQTQDVCLNTNNAPESLPRRPAKARVWD
jgi:signal transduction histidine kinase